MKIAKLVGGGLLVYTLAVACGGMSSRAGGSNTNWFETCNSTAECGSGLVCWCGVCTATCPTDCDVRAGATCSTPPASCTDETRSACAVECQKDADCSALGAGASCVDSICRKGAPGRDGGSLTCKDRIVEIGARLAPLEERVDRSCTTIADCVTFPEVSCYDNCGRLASKAGASAIAAEVAAVQKELCDPFEAAGCFYPIPPCISFGNPACVAGQCGYAMPGAPADSGTASCDSIGNQIVDRLTTATDAADTTCRTSDDCTRSGPGASCLPDCPYRPVSKTGAAAIATERSAVEHDLCPQLDGQGCEPLIYTCPAIPAGPAVCVNGTCQDGTRGAGTKGTDAGLSCTEREDQFRSEMLTIAAGADNHCTDSSDCTSIFLANQCFDSCSAAYVSSAGATTVQDALDRIDRDSCGAFAQAGCKVTRLPCPGPGGVPVCVGGKCMSAS